MLGCCIPAHISSEKQIYNKENHRDVLVAWNLSRIPACAWMEQPRFSRQVRSKSRYGFALLAVCVRIHCICMQFGDHWTLHRYLCHYIDKGKLSS